MDDEKIINGIDVSECEHHYTNPVNGIIYHGCAIYEQINDLGYSQDTLCEQNPNCYFKQFKRLQEENKELKKRCEEWALETVKMQGAIDGKDFRIDKYKQTLEEIKAEIGDLKDINKLINLQKILDKINEVLN